VDALVLTLLGRTTFTYGDLVTTHEGRCRLHPQLARAVVAACRLEQQTMAQLADVQRRLQQREYNGARRDPDRRRRQSDGHRTSFVILELDESYHHTVRALQFEPTSGGFARRFAAETPGLAQIYAHFAHSIEDVIYQKAGERPVPWDHALEVLLHRSAGQPLGWRLVGSAALAVRGFDVAPRDVDLVVDEADVPPIAASLRDTAIEPLTRVVGWSATWFGRAFVGALVEWVGGVDKDHYWGAALRHVSRAGCSRGDAVPH
jgi:hypothetical protein